MFAFEQSPHKPVEKYINKGIVLHHKNQLSQALYWYERALHETSEDHPYRSIILYNIGLVYYGLKNYVTALDMFMSANTIKVTSENYWHMCLCYLYLGEWEKGMNLYHYRYKARTATKTHFPDLPVKQFTSLADLEGLNILILKEQGLGDECMFSPMLRKLDMFVNKAYVQVRPENLVLFKKLYGYRSINFMCFESISFQDMVNMKLNGWIAFGDLFSNSYRKEDLCQNWYSPRPSNLETGICWGSNPEGPKTQQKTIDKKELQKVNNWTSLQYGQLGFHPKNTWETFKKFDSLRAVVTVDTALAHLAGLHGIPTTLLVDEYCDWRWTYKNPYSGNSMLYNNIGVETLDVWRDKWLR